MNFSPSTGKLIAANTNSTFFITHLFAGTLQNISSCISSTTISETTFPSSPNIGCHIGKICGTIADNVVTNIVLPPITNNDNLLYVSDDLLIACGWDSNSINNEMLIELNNVLIKYKINTPARLSHFLTQCIFESSYASFKSPDCNDAQTIDKEYQTLLKEASNLNLNISQFTDIVDMGYSYVSENYAWECSGYDWMVKQLNQSIDEGATVDDVSSKINRWDTKNFPQKAEIYNLVSNTIGK